MNISPLTPSSDVTEQIARVIWMLCQTVSERSSLRVRTLSGAQVEYIVARLLAARKRFRRVVALIRAGKPPRIRARKPKVRKLKPKPPPEPPLDMTTGFRVPPGWQRWAREDRVAARLAAKARAAWEKAAAAAKPQPLWRTLRQHLPGWLCRCAPAIPEFPTSAAAHANELRRLLSGPEMQALLLSHPYVGDALSKLCHALGLERSLLHRAPRVVAAPVAAEPADSGTPPDAPTQAGPAPVAGDAAASPAAAPGGTRHSPGATVAPPAPPVDDVDPLSATPPPTFGRNGFFESG